MPRTKRSFTSNFKAKIALDLIREVDTVARICAQYKVHPTQAGKWKQQVMAGLQHIFDNKPDAALEEKEILIEDLYKQIGQMKVELDWLKKKANSS